MSQSPDDEAGEPRPDTGPEDSADSLLRDVAQALEPTARSPEGPRASDASESSRPRLAAGILIAGRYRLDHVLGEGGMGEVWAATHAITRRRVAMKFVKASASMRPEMRQRFLREARASSLVQHPGLVEVLDVFELDGGVPVMVMDLLVGETLGARLAREKALPVGQAVALLLPAIEAIETAHRMGIVHRDLKPDNIFLKKGDGGAVTVKVLDFGIAKLTAKEGDAADTGSITGTGSLVGTLWYMAPEQCYGEKDIDHRADVWALGVILYECLAGQRPVEGSNVGQLVKAMLHDGIMPIEKRVPGLPPELSHLITRMLSPARGDRPQSLAQVRDALSGLAAKGRLPMASADPAAAGGAAIRGKSSGDPAPTPPRWDTAGPHAVPGPRASSARAFGGRRVAAGAAAAATAAVIGWSVWHAASPRTRDAPVVSAGPVVGQDALSASIAPVPEPAAVIPTSPPPESQRVPVDFTHAAATHPEARRTRAVVDAGIVTPKDAIAASSTSGAANANAAPPRRPGDGGFVQEVPF
jgi:tRNA A-37 threonylcarbamoyl transferase component Bud32